MGEVSTALQEADAAGVEVSSDDAQSAKLEVIKGSTAEGLRAKRDEMRSATAFGEASKKVSVQFDNLTSEEIDAAEAAVASGDSATMKQINTSASERAATKQNVEAAEAQESEITPEKLAAEKAEVIAEGKEFYKYNQSYDLQTIGHLPKTKMDSIQTAIEATELDEKFAAYMKKTGQNYNPGDYRNIPFGELSKITQTFPERSNDEFLKAQEVVAAKIIAEVQKDPELQAQVMAVVHESNVYRTKLKNVQDKIAAYNEKLLKYSVDSGDSKVIDSGNRMIGKKLIPGELLKTGKITEDNLNLGGSNDPTYLGIGAIAQQKVFNHFKTLAAE